MEAEEIDFQRLGVPHRRVGVHGSVEVTMPYLSATRIAELKEQLSHPQSPGSIMHLHDAAVSEMGHTGAERSAVFFNQPGMSFLREAWLAAQLAATTGADRIFLPTADPPDAILRHESGEERQVEIVEIYRPGRLRGDEYRLAADKAERDELDIEEFDEATAFAIDRQLPELLRAQIRRKAVKTTYRRDFELLTYFAEGSFGWTRDKVEPRLREATRESRLSFSRIWLIWESRLYRLWDNGRPGCVRPIVYPKPE